MPSACDSTHMAPSSRGSLVGGVEDQLQLQSSALTPVSSQTDQISK